MGNNASRQGRVFANERAVSDSNGPFVTDVVVVVVVVFEAFPGRFGAFMISVDHTCK